MKKALIVAGGWVGHEPVEVSKLFTSILEEEGYTVESAFDLSVYEDRKKLKTFDLLIPHWTMGVLTPPQLEGVLDAIASGVGVAGCHAGLADAFHNSTDWHWMAGSQLVSHPGGGHMEYKVHLCQNGSSITEGLEDFTVVSELYYLHVDPCVNVLGTISYPVGEGPFTVDDYAIINQKTPGYEMGEWYGKDEYKNHNPHLANNPIQMPAIYTKSFGKGKVFYCSVGHNSKMLSAEPLRTIMKRGFLWATR